MTLFTTGTTLFLKGSAIDELKVPGFLSGVILLPSSPNLGGLVETTTSVLQHYDHFGNLVCGVGGGWICINPHLGLLKYPLPPGYLRHAHGARAPCTWCLYRQRSWRSSEASQHFDVAP